MDWTGTETDTVSPQALRANISPRMFQTKFFRQWFSFPLFQLDVSSVGATATHFDDL